MAMGDRLFMNNCAQCHGSDARGSKGFPNLTDTDWLHGGTPDKIKESLINGRIGQMPPMAAAVAAPMAAAAAAPMAAAAAAPRQINVLSSELDDLTRLLQGTSLGPSANAAAGVAAGAPAPPPVPPPSPPYSPSPDAILAELDGLMIRLGHNLHITEDPNYAPRSPRGGRSNRKTKRKTRTRK